MTDNKQTAKNKKTKGKSGVLCGDIHVRLPERVKNRLENEAQELNTNVSNVVRMKLLEKDNRKCDFDMLCTCAALCQDILNYIEEKYDCAENEVLKEMVDKLWELL